MCLLELLWSRQLVDRLFRFPLRALQIEPELGCCRKEMSTSKSCITCDTQSPVQDLSYTIAETCSPHASSAALMSSSVIQASSGRHPGPSKSFSLNSFFGVLDFQVACRILRQGCDEEFRFPRSDSGLRVQRARLLTSATVSVRSVRRVATGSPSEQRILTGFCSSCTVL
jgi:hypothetical protein